MTLTLISEVFPVEKRGAAIGLWGGITGLAVALGPVVGGAIVGGISWHWIFWLNVPIGLALIPLSMSRLTESFGPRSQLDIVGLVLAGAGFFGVTWDLYGPTHRLGHDRNNGISGVRLRFCRGVLEVGTANHHAHVVTGIVPLAYLHRSERRQLLHVRLAVRRACSS